MTTLSVVQAQLRRGEAYSLQELVADDGRSVRRGLRLGVEQQDDLRFTYEEWDFEKRPPELLDRRQGSCSRDAVSTSVRRHFFLCETDDEREEPWTRVADGWEWTVRWARNDDTLHLSGEQHSWLRLLHAPNATDP